eukprot:6500-Heterococcus_DN1.PRE.6
MQHNSTHAHVASYIRALVVCAYDIHVAMWFLVLSAACWCRHACTQHYCDQRIQRQYTSAGSRCMSLQYDNAITVMQGCITAHAIMPIAKRSSSSSNSELALQYDICLAHMKTVFFIAFQEHTTAVARSIEH